MLPEGYEVDTNPGRIDLDYVHGYPERLMAIVRTDLFPRT